MNIKLKINRTMKLATLLATYLLPMIMLASGNTDPKQDTVIIELDKNSKIVIITKNRSDLASLENYDINQMIRDLNAQLSDSVSYMEINDGKAYVNDDEVEMKDWKINDDEVKTLINACNHVRDKFLICLLYETGMRIGEALGLRLEDFVTGGTNEIHVTNRLDNFNGARAKSGDRTIHVNKELMQFF